MQQGDQLYIEITVEDSAETAFTPENCADFKVKIGDLPERSYLAGTLFAQMEDGNYNGVWLYPVTQADSLRLGPVTPVQAQVKFSDGTITSTPVMVLEVGGSIITTDEWPEEGNQWNQ